MAYQRVLFNTPRTTQGEINTCSNEVKVIWAVFIISTLLAIFIPSKNTLIAMYVANHVTPDNLSNAQEIITTLINQVK